MLLSGMRAWVLQRISAVYLILYVGPLLDYLLFGHVTAYDWQALQQQLWFQVATLLAVAALLVHAWVGMRDILLDYLPNRGWRLAGLSVLFVLLCSYAAWGILIVWTVGA